MTHFNLIHICLALFFLSFWGVFVIRRNIILILISMELMLLSLSLLVIFVSYGHDDVTGQIFGLLILTVAAAESAIGLAILVVYYRLRGVISVDFISALKG